MEGDAWGGRPRGIDKGDQIFEVSMIERLDYLPEESRELAVRQDLSLAVQLRGFDSGHDTPVVPSNRLRPIWAWFVSAGANQNFLGEHEHLSEYRMPNHEHIPVQPIL